ncbi:hypothetical protein [Komagataeibacter sp. FNDCR2]|uniref:hypothetical protein n=1 Tax=Komagataeibacter sp. FNDCR2 TaxID=2878682 RepID=UPI001E2A2C41|nr:hypothetical protein [Komagataeibacter sp. FNDCR2]MCE2574273.1 hypothetical protein [Komagataeibacter sp. FNDCR2]
MSDRLRHRGMAPLFGLILLCLPHASAGAQTPGGWNGSVVIPPAPTFSPGSAAPPVIPHFAPLPTGSAPTRPSWPWESDDPATPPDMNPRETPSPDRYQRDWSAFRRQEQRIFKNGHPDSPP